MRTSLKGQIALAVSEGVVVEPYLDSVSVWTIGIGHTLGAGAPDPRAFMNTGITIEQAMSIFATDLKKFEQLVLREVKVPLLQHEFDAIVHFVFNTGTLHTKNGKPSQLLTKLNAGDKVGAFSTGFHGWLKPKELKGRRDKERNMALNGSYGATLVPIYRTANNKPKFWKHIDGAKLLNSGTTPVPTPTPTPQPQQPVAKESFIAWLWRKLGFA